MKFLTLSNNSRIKNIIKILKAVQWDNPPKANVLILDEMGSDYIEQMIVYGLDFSILHSLMEVVYLSPQILLLFLKNLARALWRKTKEGEQWFPWEIYLLSCIEYIGPKVVVTFIDNSPVYQNLSRRYAGGDFYLIQNGVRLKVDAEVDYTIKMTNLCCWGQSDIDLFSRNNHRIDNYMPLGPLVGSYYKTELSSGDIEDEYDVCLVSQWRNQFMNGESAPHLKKAVSTVNEYLAQYLHKHPVKACVATCAQVKENLTREIAYYRDLFGDDVTIIPRERKTFSTYAAMDRSTVIIGFSSSAVYEAYGWGKKVLLCNYSDDYKWDNASVIEDITISGTDYLDFERKLNKILNMDAAEYKNMAAANMKYAVNFNAEMPAHKYLRQKIVERIK